MAIYEALSAGREGEKAGTASNRSNKKLMSGLWHPAAPDNLKEYTNLHILISFSNFWEFKQADALEVLWLITKSKFNYERYSSLRQYWLFSCNVKSHILCEAIINIRSD